VTGSICNIRERNSRKLKRIIERRSQVVPQTIEIVGLTVYHNILLTSRFSFSSTLAFVIWKRACFFYFYMYIISLISFSLYSQSCWAHPLLDRCFSGCAKALVWIGATRNYIIEMHDFVVDCNSFHKLFSCISVDYYYKFW